MNILLPDLETRLQSRYELLVREHLSPPQRLAAGLRALPDTATSFAHTQAAWRFYANPRISLPALAEPLIQATHEGAAAACQRFLLVAHDWSLLHYTHHNSKQDRIPLRHRKDLGYELYTGLALGDQDGVPLGPLGLSVTAADGVYSTRLSERGRRPTKLDSVGPWLDHYRQQGFALPLVHIIDREADSLAHYRRWIKRGHYLLIRADSNRRVKHQGQSRLLPEVVEQLRREEAFAPSRKVFYHGRQEQQWVAGTSVVLDRPAKRKHGRCRQPGAAITMRLVVSEVRSAAGEVLAVWLLLTTVPATVTAAEVALWYYWRWRIESCYKLLKSAGLQLEQWQQETAAATVKRLLVGFQACVMVWRLERGTTPAASRLRKLLVRLSGRQMKRGVEYTTPALLAGLWVVVQTQALLEHIDPDELRELIEAAWDLDEPQNE